MLSRDKAPVGKVKTNPDGSVDVKSTVAPGQRFPGDGQVRARVIPGMAPEQAAAAEAAAAKKKAEKEKQKAKEEEKKKAAAAAAAAAEAEAARQAEEASRKKSPDLMTREEKDKRMRAVKKKLSLIAELKAKGGELNEDQKGKVAGEPDLLAELAALSV